MSNLKDYIEEAISSGKHRFGSEYKNLRKKTSFDDFINILDDLGYRNVTPNNGYISEMYSIQTLINKVGENRDTKSYIIQNLKTAGYFRVVLYYGKDKDTSGTMTVYKVDFNNNGKCTIDDIELYYKYGPHTRDAEDMSIEGLIEYIDLGER